MRTRITRSLTLAALPFLLLTACDPGAAKDAPLGSPATSEAPVLLGDDVLLVVSATATADNGAVLHLNMLVHRATAWNDSAAADRPSAMTTGCDGYLDAGVYEASLWSFLSVEVSATADPTLAAWPADRRIRLFPGVNGEVALASDGFLVEDPDVDDATPHCQRVRYLYGAGDGSVIAGIQGDTDEVDAAGHFTRWANQRYGFVAREVSGQTAAEAGIAISDCAFEVTDAGLALDGAAEWWGELVDESNCHIGSTST